MAINHTKLLSGRSAVVDYGNLTADRYQFLALGQAEPNLGPGTANNILTLSTDNERVWTDSLTLSTITATGNISANYFFGNGSQLTGIAAASAYANALIGNTLSPNVLYSSLQTVGILENLSVSGNAVIGNISISDTTFSSIGNLITFAGNSGIGIPSGNTSQRPGSPDLGATRFNTILDTLETWNGVIWVTNGNTISPGNIIDQQITPDGTSDTYALIVDSTSAGILVSINGINQLPNVAYAVTGNLITFTQTPFTTDIIDIRFITYLTSVTSLTNAAGNGIVNVTPTGNIEFTTSNNLFATMTANSFNVLNPISSTGNITAPYFIGNIVGNISGNIIVPGANTQVLYNLDGNIGAGAGLTFNQTSNTLAITGNLTSGNISIIGNIVANQFIGSGSTLNNIQGANVSGNVASATIAYTAYSVSGANVSGNVASANIAYTAYSVSGANVAGNVANATYATTAGTARSVSGANVSGTVANATYAVISGTSYSVSGSNVSGAVANATYAVTSGTASTVTSNAQANITSVGILNNLSVSGNVNNGNLLTSGIVSAIGNITAPYFIGNLIGNISGNLTVPGANTQVIYNNAGQANASSGLTFDFSSNSLVSTGTVTGSNFLTGGYISAAGNVIGNRIIGNGALLSSITGSNISGTVANATYANTAGIVATVTSNAQPNITSVGILTSLSVSGNVIPGNILTTGQLSASGNITTAGYFFGTFAGNISGNLTVPGSNTQVIYNNNGNAGASTGFTFDSAANALVVTGNITGGRIIGNGALLSSITGSNVTGTVANATYSVSSGTTATITANAQPNITSVGALTSLTVTANVNGGNILTAGIVSATGNITAPYFIGNVIGNISGNLTVPGANTQVIYNNSGQANASAGFTFNSAANAIVVTGNVTGGNILTAGLISSTGNITGNFFNGNGSLLTGITAVSATTAATVTTNAQPNITSVGTLTSLTVTANVTGGNILTLGIVSATGNITAPYFIGNVVGNISGNITVPGANTQVIYNNAGQANASSGFTFDSVANAIVVTGNVTGGNILTAGLISSTGNITGGNLSVGTGTITVGNIVNSNANAVGNIGSSSNYFNTVFAKATSALYADLAENYLADAEYAPGTVLSFGGEEELTVSTQDNDSLIAGIVSTNPAYTMNSGLLGNFVVTLALLGRVPCLVQGPVKAGDMMVSAGNGRARAEVNPKIGTVIGKAITSFAGNLGVIEILIGKI
jgi:hypothetical protein